MHSSDRGSIGRESKKKIECMNLEKVIHTVINMRIMDYVFCKKRKVLKKREKDKKKMYVIHKKEFIKCDCRNCMYIHIYKCVSVFVSIKRYVVVNIRETCTRTYIRMCMNAFIYTY